VRAAFLHPDLKVSGVSLVLGVSMLWLRGEEFRCSDPECSAFDGPTAPRRGCATTALGGRSLPACGRAVRAAVRRPPHRAGGIAARGRHRGRSGRSGAERAPRPHAPHRPHRHLRSRHAQRPVLSHGRLAPRLQPGPRVADAGRRLRVQPLSPAGRARLLAPGRTRAQGPRGRRHRAGRRALLRRFTRPTSPTSRWGRRSGARSS
jgi:hypothetical protein